MRSLLLLLVVALPIHDAAACQCVRAGAVEGARRHELAFVGRIVRENKTVMNPDRCRRVRDECAYEFGYTVAVEGVWKGKVAASVEIPAGTAMGDCSIGRLRGERWVFVTDDKRVLNMCSGTQPATAAVVDAMTTAFGAPAKP